MNMMVTTGRCRNQTEILAVADGLVIESRDRDVSTYPCPNGSIQREVFIRHDVGTGVYRESFVTYYAHLAARDVFIGDVVTKGRRIGWAGHTGCATGDHLHFSTTRITNTVGWYQHEFHSKHTAYMTPGDHGDNSYAGRIEPLGWAAPKRRSVGVDESLVC